MSFVLIAPFSLQLNCCFLQKEGVYCLIGNLMLNVFQSCDCNCFSSISCFIMLSMAYFHIFILPKRLSFSFYIHSLPSVPSVAIVLKHLTCVLHMTITTRVSWCYRACFYYLFPWTFRFLDWSLWTLFAFRLIAWFMIMCAFDLCILTQTNKPLNVICCVSCWLRPHFHRQCNITSGY